MICVGRITKDRIEIKSDTLSYIRALWVLGGEWVDNQQYIRPMLLDEGSNNYGGW